MKPIQKLIDNLNGLTILQTKEGWADNIPEAVWSEWFEGKFRAVADDCNHISFCRSVIEIQGGLMAVRYIATDNIETCKHTLSFFEVEAVQTITYKRVY